MTTPTPRPGRPITPTKFEIIALVLLAAGILVYSFTANNANACANALIGALAANKCTPWVGFHNLSIAAMWIGAVTFTASVIIGILAKGR